MSFKLSNPLSFMLSILILFSTFYSAANGILKLTGFVSVMLLLSFNLFFIYFYMMTKANRNLYIENRKIYMAFILYTIWIGIGVLYSEERKQGIQILLLSIFYMSLLITIPNLKLTAINRKIINSIILIFFILNFVYISIFYNSSRFSFYFSNPNSYAAFMYYLMFLFLMTFTTVKMFKLIKVLFVLFVTIVVAWLTQSLTMVLCFVLSLTIIGSWKLITRNKLIYKLFLYTVLISIIAFTYLYPLISFNHSFDNINQLFLEYTGQRFYSGRNKVWFDLIQLGSKNNLFGYGTGVLPKDLFRTDLSSHNLYLQIYIQNGLISLLLLFFIINGIWNKIYKYKENPSSKIFAGLFIGIIVHQTFEVTLLQNNISIGTLQWILVAIGLNSLIGRKEHKIEQSVQ